MGLPYRRCPLLLPSSDPRAFGPLLWDAMHVLAENYPECPSTRKGRWCRRYLFAISHMLPCRACGRHFRKYLREHDVWRAVETRAGLVALLVGAHNAVSAHARPSRAPFTVEEAHVLYATAPATRPLAGVWGDEPYVGEANPYSFFQGTKRSCAQVGMRRWRRNLVGVAGLMATLISPSFG